MRAKLLDWLTFSGDVTTSRATFDAGGVVPLAPLVTARADLAASLAMRHLGDRYADEERQQTGGRRNSISHRGWPASPRIAPSKMLPSENRRAICDVTIPEASPGPEE